MGVGVDNAAFRSFNMTVYGGEPLDAESPHDSHGPRSPVTLLVIFGRDAGTVEGKHDLERPSVNCGRQQAERSTGTLTRNGEEGIKNTAQVTLRVDQA